MTNLHSFLSILAYTSLILLLGTGCSNAQSDTLPTVLQSASSTTGENFQIKPRKTYISPETTKRLQIQNAAKIFRKDALAYSRPFFLLPEESGKALSVGDTRDGYMIHGMPYPFPSVTARQLPVQYERGLIYGTNDLMKLLEDTAEVMQKRYPDTWMYLGNIAAREGGDIPYSISHNAGRDADIGYYLNDENGHFAQPQDMYKINRKMVSRGSGVFYSFDIEKNATLIETLLMHKTVHVQFIFVAKHLRRALYEELVRRESPQEVLDRFEQSVQNQAAHDDHFHIRIYCSDADISAGCIDKSTIHPWQRDPEPVRAKYVKKYVAILQNQASDELHKSVALQRLPLLGAAAENADLILSFLNDADSVVRSTAALASRSLGKNAAKLLDEHIQNEKDPSVTPSLFDALAVLDTPQTRQTFIRELARNDGSIDPKSLEIMFRYITRHPHESYLKPLISALETQPGNANLLDALNTVTNQNFCAPDTAPEKCRESIAHWVKKNGNKPRQQWLIDGFKHAGYNVSALENSAIPALLDAIDGPRALSINAQLALKDLSHLEQDSLDWSLEDARWHYTRFFKKREKQYGINLSDRDERGNKL